MKQLFWALLGVALPVMGWRINTYQYWVVLGIVVLIVISD